MTKWIEVTEERYDEMLGVLPPEIMTGLGFLVGEPSDHMTCSVTGRLAANYQPFVQICGKFYECESCMTVAEFKRVDFRDVLASVAGGVS